LVSDKLSLNVIAPSNKQLLKTECTVMPKKIGGKAYARVMFEVDWETVKNSKELVLLLKYGD
jgi:hypothetical protein